MGKIILCILLTLAIIYIVPFVVYSIFHSVTGLDVPKGVSPARLLLSFLVSKIGTAIAFVLIFYFARDSLSEKWLLYAAIWWLAYILGEVGQAIGPNYSWKEAVAGMIAETVYFPASAWVTHWMIGLRP